MAHPEFAAWGAPKSKVMEEMGEVLQIMGKVERFGIDNRLPNELFSSNRENLLAEIDDLQNALQAFKEELQ